MGVHWQSRSAITLLKVVCWGLVGILLFLDLGRVSTLYLEPRQLLRMHVGDQLANYRLLAVDDYMTIRGGTVTWTFAVQAFHENTLASKCKQATSVRTIGAYYKFAPKPLAPGEAAPTFPPKPKLSDASGCLLADWEDPAKKDGGSAILSGNLLQIEVWYD